jgi:hypothetical protein
VIWNGPFEDARVTPSVTSQDGARHDFVVIDHAEWFVAEEERRGDHGEHAEFGNSYDVVVRHKG